MMTVIAHIQMKVHTSRHGLHLLGSRRRRSKVALFLVHSVKELGSGNTCNFEFCKSCFEGVNTDEHAIRWRGRCNRRHGDWTDATWS